MVNHIKEKRTNNESRGDSRDLLIAKDSTNTHTNTLLCTNPLKPHCFHAYLTNFKSKQNDRYRDSYVVVSKSKR